MTTMVKPLILMPQEDLLQKLDNATSEERIVKLLRWASPHTKEWALRDASAEHIEYFDGLLKSSV